MIHELKILSKYFKEVKKDVKTFEIRKNDRNFKVGDVLVLEEYDHNNKWTDLEGNEVNYSGKKTVRIINYILSNIDGLDKEYVILGIKHITQDIELKWHDKDRMKEWGNISCPMLNNEEVMTYCPKDAIPYDTVTNPFINEDGDLYVFKYDHDIGGWEEDTTFMLAYGNEYIRLKDIVKID